MSWTHSSRVLGVLLAVAIVATGTATALSVTGSAPAPAEVGSDVSMSATINEPFSGDAPSSYTLRATTQLENASITILAKNQQGNVLARTDAAGPTAELVLEDPAAVEVEVQVNNGRVPALDNFSYQQMSVENYTALSLIRVKNGAETEIRTFTAHRYTAESRAARTAIDEADAAIDQSSSQEARDKLQQAIDAYNSENFGLAQDLAAEAQNIGEDTSDSGGLPLPLIIGGAVIALLVIGGAAYYFSGGDDDSYKLQ